MDIELTPEQVNQIVRAARVLASGFTEEQLRWLIDCQRRLAEPGFCEATHGLARLEKESNCLEYQVNSMILSLEKERNTR